MNDLFLTLRMNLSDSAPEGAGWYIYAAAAGDQENAPRELIPGVRVAPQAAALVAQSFEHVLQGSLPENGVTPLQLVGSGNNLIRQAVQRQLQFAEEWARRVKTLRQSLQALESASDKVEEPPERQE